MAIQDVGGEVYRTSFTPQLTASEGSDHLATIPSIEQSMKSANQDEDPVRVIHYRRSVSGLLLSHREREL